MPKIKDTRFQIDGKWFSFPLYYSSSEGFYLKGFPESVLIGAGAKGQGHTTEGGCMRYHEDAIRAYHENTKTQRKVILYMIFLPTGKRMNKVGEGSYQGVNPNLPNSLVGKVTGLSGADHGESPDFGFGLSYRAVYAIDKNGTSYHRINDDGSLGYNLTKKKAEFEIPWSESKMEFFKSLEESSDAMLYKLCQFFAKPENELEFIMSSGSINGVKLLGK